MSPGFKRHAGSHRDRFFAGGLDIEGDPALALDLLHAVIEQARQQHVPQPNLQLLGLQVRIPGAYRALIVPEHAYHLHRELLDVARGCGHIRTLHRAGRGDANVTEVRLLPGPGQWGRNMQARPWGHEAAS